MTRRQAQRQAQRVGEAIRAVVSTDITVACDRDGTIYLHGEVLTPLEKGTVVAVALAAGASRVFEGLVLGRQHAAPMERRTVVVPHRKPSSRGLRTAAQRLLGSADLSDRLFDCVVGHVTTGNPST